MSQIALSRCRTQILAVEVLAIAGDEFKRGALEFHLVISDPVVELLARAGSARPSVPNDTSRMGGTP
jgi:hypothetical protein